jgi:hypothetical protein
MCYDLNLILGRQVNKKITLGRPDGKHVLQAPTSYKIRSLANHFAKSTKYVTKESEHYMEHPRIHNRLRPYRIQNPRVHSCLRLYQIQNPRVLAAYDLTGSRIRRYISRLRPHWIQNPAHKINILQDLGHQEQSPRPTLTKQSTSRYFS